MRRFASMPRQQRFALALLFALSITAYTAIWTFYSFTDPPAEPVGLTLLEQPARTEALVVAVEPGSPVDSAGLRTGDVITAINGRPMESRTPYFDAVVRGQPGDQVTFAVRDHQGSTHTIELKLSPRKPALEPDTATARLASLLTHFYPFVFLVVGLVVLFQRLDDGHAWLLAIVFACFIAGPEYQEIVPELHPAIRHPVHAYSLLLAFLGPAVFYIFFATFPIASPIERWAPWLKWAALVAGAAFTLPCVAAAWQYNSHFPFYVRTGWVSTQTFAHLHQWNLFGWVALGFFALMASVIATRDSYAKRRVRVILWGTLAGFGPMLVAYFLVITTGNRLFANPAVRIVTNGLLMLVPLSMAYAVIKHRVLEMPVLLKRSARYMLVRGSFAVVMTIIAVVVPVRFANVTAQALNFPSDAIAPFALLLGVAFGMLWVVGAGEVEKRIMPRIDRAFFRSVYDARQILGELAHRAHSVSSRDQLAALLRQHIRQALHPKSIAIYFEVGEGTLQLQDPTGRLPDSLNSKEPLLEELASHGRPWEVPASDEEVPAWSHLTVNLPQLANLRAVLEQEMGRPTGPEGRDVIAALAPAVPECLVPLVGRDSRLLGLVVLGQRRSEEPYSDEDERLLASVAGQAAIALDNMRLAESMAEKLEGERKAAAEIAIAREVQSRLFPQTHPPMATIEYTGLCDQARKVGGDYYDFLDLGAGRIGLVLADISGKGIFAALLMANLQANLRSQYARAQEDLPGLMRSVNRLFHQSTSSGLYATMFFADYSDATRLLRYVNCGHNPPLIVRADGSQVRLESTATVIGLLDPWDCEVGDAELRPGDVLVIYSDGVTEAQSDAGEFFGEDRLLEATRACAHLPIAEAARAIAQTVHAFSESTQEDDLTLLMARAR